MKKVLLSALAACVFTVSTIGCTGSFTLTNKINKWNESVTGNKYVNGAISFLLFVTTIKPLLAVVGDMMFLNTIEFWTGSNPLASGDTYKETDANGNTVTAVKMEDGSLFMRVETKDGKTEELVLQQDEEILRILDNKGNVLKETALAE